MKPITQIKLFVSSPSDTKQEREAVEEIINQINQNEGLEKSYNVVVYRWEKNYISDWGTYQGKINKVLANIDIYVGIFKNRFGTPTKNYGSGTEEEFEITRKLHENGENIEFCFFQCEKNDEFDPKVDEQLKQRRKINSFLKKYNGKVFGINGYGIIDEFKIKFKNAALEKIGIILSRIENNLNRAYDLEMLNKRFDENGITKIYISHESNDERNHDKKEFLKEEKGEIYLLAHTGNSYLNPSLDNNRGGFYNHVKDRLHNKPDNFKVLLLNPYSLEARKIFYAENFHLKINDISSIKNTNVIEQGNNYQRFNQCIQSIDKLKKELGNDSNRLEVRITNMATDGTILMSNSRLFYEPYIVSRFLNRIEKGLNLFEIQIENLLKNKQCSSIYNRPHCEECGEKDVCSQNLYKTLAEQFYILWSTSVSLTEYKEQLNKYKEDFSKNQPDLLFKQIVQLHDSWLAFDPIIGCNGNCVYCFLGPQGWKDTTPDLRKSPHEDKTEYLRNAYEKELLEYQFNSNHCGGELLGNIPVSIGNKTDMLYGSNNKEILKNILDLHEEKNKKRPLVLITKQKIDLDIVDMIKKYSFDTIILYSIAFLPKDFEPNVPSYKERLASAKKIREKIQNEKITNIYLVHYWRPIVKDFLTEKLDDIFSQVKSIFDCSICIRLVINVEIFNSIKSNHAKLYDYIKNKNNNEDILSVTDIMEPSFEEIQKAAKKHSHPVFQHTSCALSYVQKKADFNGSMWRENFCNNCVPEQKDRCKYFKKNWNENDYIPNLDKEIGSNYTFKDDCIIVNSTISQEKINYLTHLTGKPAFSDSVQLTLVWPSSNQIYFKKKYSKKDAFEAVRTEYPKLTAQLERLKGITGFISVLGNDKRIAAFNRHDHVNRVVRLLKWYIDDLKDLDLKKCALLGLFHDINRLPFAHNLERAVNFSQADTLRDYMALFDTDIDIYYDDFRAFFDKNLNVSPESRIVYLIDSVDGFIEDSFFALATLNLNYTEISEDILTALGFDDKEILEQNITRLKELYNRDIYLFSEEFGDIVFEYTKAFINKYRKDKYKMFDDDWFLPLREKIRKELLAGKIFPINNEIVSKGSKLASEIGKPYIEYLEKSNQRVYATLFKQTDRDLLKEAVSKKIITNEEDYYPNLNP